MLTRLFYSQVLVHSRLYLVALTLVVGLVACQSNGGKQLDSPTQGEITVAAEAAYGELGRQLVQAYQEVYPNTKINLQVAPEPEAFKLLLEDSARVILAGRRLNKQEKGYFKQKKIVPKTTHIARDGLAVIVNPNNPDSVLSMNTLKGILAGDYRTWNEVPRHSSHPEPETNPLQDTIRILFGSRKSGHARFLQDSLLAGQSLSPNAYTRDSVEALVSYVANNRGAMGIVGVSWLVDYNDSMKAQFADSIQVVWLSEKQASEPHQPYQYSLYREKYPLTRDVYVISGEARTGLGTGFAAFAAGQDNGQMIVHRMAMMPARGVYRLVEMQEDDPRKELQEAE